MKSFRKLTDFSFDESSGTSPPLLFLVSRMGEIPSMRMRSRHFTFVFNNSGSPNLDLFGFGLFFYPVSGSVLLFSETGCSTNGRTLSKRRQFCCWVMGVRNCMQRGN